MPTIQYVKPVRDNLFLVGLVAAISLLFWFYFKFNPLRLLSIDAFGAAGLILFALVALTIGIRKITYDGNTLVLRYSFWYTRKYQAREIEKITFLDRAEYSGVVLLIIFKNGEKFSRGITGSNAKPFAEKLCAYFT
jgi:hypothetical protein